MAEACHEPGPHRRRLIVNADDFGRSPAINAAVIRAHRDGILTTASLMVNEPACAEAVGTGPREPHPRRRTPPRPWSAAGRAAPRGDPRAGRRRGRFSTTGPAGLRYFFQPRPPRRNCARRSAPSLRVSPHRPPAGPCQRPPEPPPAPAVFRILLESRPGSGPHLRLTRDPLGLNARLAQGRWAYRSATP